MRVNFSGPSINPALRLPTRSRAKVELVLEITEASEGEFGFRVEGVVQEFAVIWTRGPSGIDPVTHEATETLRAGFARSMPTLG